MQSHNNRFDSDRFRGYYDRSRNGYHNQFVKKYHKDQVWDINAKLRHLSMLKIGGITDVDYGSILEILHHLISMLREEYKYCHWSRERGFRSEKGPFRYDKYVNKYQNKIVIKLSSS